MIARVANVTPALLAMLRTRNDDGTPELVVGPALSRDAWREAEESAACAELAIAEFRLWKQRYPHATATRKRPPAANVEHRGAIAITRHDGTELSATERAHVEAALAAHAAEPIE